MNTPNLRVNADFRYYAPLTEASRKNGLLSGFESFHMSRYQFAESWFSILSYSSLRFNLLESSSKGNNLVIFLAPSLNYRLTENLDLGAFSTLIAAKPNGASIDSFDVSTFNVGPGVIWSISRDISFSPSLRIPVWDAHIENISFFAIMLARVF